jgi:hypothetical protein
MIGTRIHRKTSDRGGSLPGRENSSGAQRGDSKEEKKTNKKEEKRHKKRTTNY